jgi:hypothetical protein
MTQPELPPDFKEFLFCLTSRGVRFLIVGAHALAAAGLARPTQDIDVLVEPTKANARRLALALTDFGFGEMAKAAEAHFSRPDRMATLGREPIRIDVLSSISGVTFARAWKGRTTVPVGDLELPFLGLAELRATKRAAGRPKDVDDLHRLDEVLGPAKKGVRLGSKRRRPTK